MSLLGYCCGSSPRRGYMYRMRRNTINSDAVPIAIDACAVSVKVKNQAPISDTNPVTIPSNMLLADSIFSLIELVEKLL